jgi:hypothetical protein
MTTALICSHDHLIRALYDAKAALKEASSAYVTADHNYKACCSDRDAKMYHLEPLSKIRDDAHDELCKVEKTYDGIHALCTKLEII